MGSHLTILDPIGAECEEALALDTPTHNASTLEGEARRLAAKGRRLEEIARRCRLEVVLVTNLPRSEFAILLPLSRKILVRSTLTPAQLLVAIAHELAHAILGADASHASVWYLALALLFPPQTVSAVRARCGAAITAQDLYDGCAPKWAAVLRERLLNGWRPKPRKRRAA